MTTTSLQRAYAATQAGKLIEAAQWFSKAVTEDPDDIQTRALLGQTLCKLGHSHDGCAQLREAGEYLLENAEDDGIIGPVLDVVEQLQRWSDFPSALALCSAATKIRNSDARALRLLAVSHAQLNQRAEALRAGEQALRLAPHDPMMQVFQGSLEADAGLAEQAQHRLEALLRPELDTRVAFRAHKELARILDKRGDYDQAFTHLNTAAALGKALPEYARQDATLLPKLIQANTAGFDPALLGRWQAADFGGERPAPVFLLGFFRSGTTLTQEVLDVHPEVFVADETDFIWAVNRELHQMDRSNASTAEKLRKLDLAGVKRLREFYWARARARFGNALEQRVFVDKFTMNTVDVGLINCIFPDAKVLFVMRDPRDVCLSCFMQLMVPTPATVHLLDWQDIAGFYALVMDWWMHIRQRLTLQFMEFRYEDAVEAFEPTYRKVFEFLELAWDPAATEFHKHAATKFIASPSRTQVAQPLYASSVARWRHYTPEFAAITDRLRPFIAAFSYPS